MMYFIAASESTLPLASSSIVPYGSRPSLSGAESMEDEFRGTLNSTYWFPGVVVYDSPTTFVMKDLKSGLSIKGTISPNGTRCIFE